jgi:hypothetical protein
VNAISYRLFDVIGKLWALPCTLLGLAFALFGYAVSLGRTAPMQMLLGNNAVQFLNHTWVLTGRAVVLGNVIIYGRGAHPGQCGVYGDDCVQLGRHEQAHTYQYQVLGVLFIAAYFLLGGLRGPRVNPFERAAQRYGAGQGSWWPG